MTHMTVRVVAFARVRELLGFGERDLELPFAATARDAWGALAGESDALAAIAGTTRLARNGSLVDGDATLFDGDELALLPPVGGG
jgi:molybdopterin converting factor small subunit